LKLLHLETITFSDATLNDINIVLCYVLSQYLYACLLANATNQHFVSYKALSFRKKPLQHKPTVQENRTHVAHMTEGDFYASEKSHIMEAANTVSIIFTPTDREQSSECLKLKPVLG
jgi:hypothetical protein